MQETLDLIYSDSQVNSFETMVSGSDLCDILGLFFDLAESMDAKFAMEREVLEKFKLAYNNKVRRDKKKEKEGGNKEDPLCKAL